MIKIKKLGRPKYSCIGNLAKHLYTNDKNWTLTTERVRIQPWVNRLAD